jgi:hypothetical protein
MGKQTTEGMQGEGVLSRNSRQLKKLKLLSRTSIAVIRRFLARG